MNHEVFLSKCTRNHAELESNGIKSAAIAHTTVRMLVTFIRTIEKTIALVRLVYARHAVVALDVAVGAILALQRQLHLQRQLRTLALNAMVVDINAIAAAIACNDSSASASFSNFNN